MKNKRKMFRLKHYHQTTDSVEEQSKVWDLSGTVQIGEWVISMVDELSKRTQPPRFKSTSAFGK